MKGIQLDDHFKGLNNLEKGQPVIQISTSFKPDGWVYCVDSKRENYCFKRIKMVEIINMDKVELIAHDSSIYYFQANGAPYPKPPQLVWQAIDYIDFRGSEPKDKCAYSCSKSFSAILNKIKKIHEPNLLELTFQFEEGEDFRTDTGFRNCYFPYHDTTNLRHLDEAVAKYWFFTAVGAYNGHLILDELGQMICSTTLNLVTNIVVTSGDY